MSLYNNAISSIKLGVHDYASGKPERLISAMRNTYAGILLLFKEKLFLLSPADSNEVLLKRKIIPKKDEMGNIVFVGYGKATVDLHEIEERFKFLGVEVEWKVLYNLQKTRNDIEHYYTETKRETIQEFLCKGFLIIHKFLTKELSKNTKEELGKKIWKKLVELKDIYKSEKEECDSEMDKIAWEPDWIKDAIKELSCSNCGSTLLKPQSIEADFNDIILVCNVCDHTKVYEEYFPTLLKEKFQYYDEFGDTNIVICSECELETYNLDEHKCMNCGVTLDHECERCFGKIPPSEIDGSGYCGWCQHQMSKDED